jgi:hypothetical protein
MPLVDQHRIPLKGRTVVAHTFKYVLKTDGPTPSRQAIEASEISLADLLSLLSQVFMPMLDRNTVALAASHDSSASEGIGYARSTSAKDGPS